MVSYQRKLVEFPAGVPGLGWRSDARCRGDSTFDWRGTGPSRSQSRFCGLCPVREDCLRDALFEGGDSAGVRAGLSAEGRRRMLRAQVTGEFDSIVSILEGSGWSSVDAARMVDEMRPVR
jgi:hypothetical protein